MGSESLVEFVVGSSVRTDVLSAITRGTTGTDDMLATLDASESAVYNAFSALERRGLIRSPDGRWEATGSGRLVADLVEQRREICTLLADEYWEAHDVSVLPRQFRIRLDELSAVDVVRASETDPHGVVREIAARIGNAESVDVISPIYHTEYDESMPDSDEARLAVNKDVVEEGLRTVGNPDEVDTYEHTSVRVLDVDVALGITDGTLLLSLPTLAGRYDSRSEVLGEGERAVAWGEALFEHYWERATPIEEVVAEFLD